VVLDACVPEVAQDISYAAAPEMVAETAPATSAADQVGINGHDESPTEGVIKTRSTGVVEVDSKEEKKGFAFTTCFRCGRVEVTQYGDHSIPKEVKGKCKVDNGIVMIVCGLCREVDDGSNNDAAGLGSSFRDLKLSPELFKGSVIYRVAKAILSQEVGFIEDEGGIAYRDVDAIVRSLRRDDRVISVDLERFGRGERTELMCGFLSGGLTNMRPRVQLDSRLALTVLGKARSCTASNRQDSTSWTRPLCPHVLRVTTIQNKYTSHL
jgi:hypothetical protein